MFRPSSTKRDTFRTAPPKYLGFNQAQPSEIRFDQRDQNIYVSNTFDQVRPSLTNRDTFRPARPKYLGFNQAQPSEIRFDQRDQNIYVSNTFDQARYVLTGATKTSRFGPSLTKRGMFLRHDQELLYFNQVRPSEIRFERRHQNIYASIKYDQV